MKKTLDAKKIDWMRKIDWKSHIHLVEPRGASRRTTHEALAEALEEVKRGELTVHELQDRVKELENTKHDNSPMMEDTLRHKIEEVIEAMHKLSSAEKQLAFVAKEMWMMCEDWGSYLHYLGSERDYMIEVRKREGKDGRPIYTPTLSPVTETTKRGRKKGSTNNPKEKSKQEQVKEKSKTRHPEDTSRVREIEERKVG